MNPDKPKPNETEEQVLAHLRFAQNPYASKREREVALQFAVNSIGALPDEAYEIHGKEVTVLMPAPNDDVQLFSFKSPLFLRMNNPSEF